MTSAAVATGQAPLTLWRFIDGKPGHQNQTAGLVSALADRVAVDSHDILVKPDWRNWLGLLTARCPLAKGLPDPDILLGAGHATHIALLACRRARGGRTVVLMQPSLPRQWFDLCIVPSHDGVAPGERVLVTRGAINAVRPATTKRDDQGLILVGGPSRHHGWSTSGLVSQVAEILAADHRGWTVATSRRTPAATVDTLRQLVDDPAGLVEPADVAPDWLAATLAQTPVAWVSEDSVSMLYEALTAGAACGLIGVPGKGASRIQRGVDELVDNGLIVRFEAWRAGQRLLPPERPLDEAGRCADWIVERWLTS